MMRRAIVIATSIGIIITQCTALAILQRKHTITICNTQKLASSRRLHLAGSNALEGIGSPSNPGWESGRLNRLTEWADSSQPNRPIICE